MKATILLSGGLDSAVAAWMCKSKEYELEALTFDYGQKNAKEISRATLLAQRLEVKKHHVISIPTLGGNALTDEKVGIPGTPKAVGDKTYVPGRNLIFLAFAAHLAELNNSDEIVAGFDFVPRVTSPDVSREFVTKFNDLQRIGTSRALNDHRPIKLNCPLNAFRRANIIGVGKSLKVPFELTWTCWRGEEKPCHECAACRSRDTGFKEAGIEDPVK